jgi:DNA (cytosine-5)-methyltransferase 1
VAGCLRASGGGGDKPYTLITMAHGQGGAEIGFDRGPTLTCNHEAPIAAYPATTHALRAEGFDASKDGAGRDTPLVPVTVGTLSCNTGPNGHDAGNFACNQAVDAGHVIPVSFHPTQDPISNTDGTTHALGCGSSGGQASIAVAMINMQGSKGNAVAQADGPSFTLNAMHGHDVHAVVAPPIMQVRRLTPRECEALQGFPQNYTAIPWRKKPASECPDGPRYKALGNSWAVPVVRWIGRRIQEQINAA